MKSQPAAQKETTTPIFKRVQQKLTNLVSFGSVEPAARLYKRIQKKRATLDRIHSVDLELNQLEGRKNQIQHDMLDARNTARGLSASKEPEEIAEKADNDTNAAQLKTELDRITRKIELLSTERCNLKTVELPGCIEETSVVEVVVHQERMKALRADAMQLENAIANERQILAEAEASIAQVQDRSEQRAKVLASMAIGEAVQSDLDTLDSLTASEKHAHQESSANAAPIISQATQTIAALEARLSDLAHMRSELERCNPLILEQLLMTEIKRVSASYMEHALAVRDSFMQLAGLEDLLKTATSHKAAILPFDLTLPLPRLPENMGLEQKGRPDLIFTTHTEIALDLRAKWRNAEHDRLAGNGLEIL